MMHLESILTQIGVSFSATSFFMNIRYLFQRCFLGKSNYVADLIHRTEKKRNVSATPFPEILFQIPLAVFASYPVQTATRRLFNGL